ncbi:SPOR domain-containing protein [Spartinivicinus poritis]|uniref:SPOR domain-containing protein n=1 Tax=Spartinivicinus poritis TaxID=2994640 RepID=A0ABT5UGB2_9GAMM|nr:SPOR domain-containing protein [Spartinivicinus sp. A2-2]MDE1465411.1 SPOR domain-containing protein [Spartinivicinus sp. A2-2]
MRSWVKQWAAVGGGLMLGCLSGCQWLPWMNQNPDEATLYAVEQPEQTKGVALASPWQCESGIEVENQWQCDDLNVPGKRTSLEETAKNDRLRLMALNLANKTDHLETIARLRQVPRHYVTIQLIAASELKTISNLQLKYPFLYSSTHVVVQSNGQPLHLLLYGVYENRMQAKKELSRLPLKQIQFLKPWVRTMANLQPLLSTAK